LPYEDEAMRAHAKEMVFPIGAPNDGFAQYFSGRSFLAPISTSQVGIFNVTFEPGCRNNWHIHHAKSGGGQILVCVAGRGYYQEEGKEAVEMKPGDCINIPAEVADAAKNVGYRACTHASNHSWDQGADGIARLWDTLDQDGIAQTGSYKTEEDSYKPLVIDSPTGGGKLGLIAGTVSLNAQTPDYDWRVDRLRESGDPNHQADIDKAVAKAKAAREQGADVVAIAMHSVQEYLDYADSWQQSEAHELADTGAFDVIYGAGCHCAQPVENYNGTWIIYGLGNAVTESANTADTLVNNQGITARIQFAGKKGVAGSWRVNRIDWVPSANETQGKYQWCSLASDHPDGTCWDETQDANVRQRIWDVLYSMGADQNVVKEWNITAEQTSSSGR
jgi:quercetin dioxygenase-like cupin family protein